MDADASTAGGELGFAHAVVPGSSGWTLLLLHGTGGDEHQLLDLGGRLAARAALLSPRGKVLEVVSRLASSAASAPPSSTSRT